jgi:hypothetical protein
MAINYHFHTSRPQVTEDEGAVIYGYAHITSYAAGGESAIAVSSKFKQPWSILFERDAYTHYFIYNRVTNNIVMYQASGVEASVAATTTCHFLATGLAHLTGVK